MDRSAITRISAMDVPPRCKRVYLLHLALCSSYKNSVRDSFATSGTREIADDATKGDDGACTMRLGVTSMLAERDRSLCPTQRGSHLAVYVSLCRQTPCPAHRRKRCGRAYM